MSTQSHLPDSAAAAGTVLSGGAATFSWLVTANEIAQLIAALVAIVSGVFAIVHYWRKLHRD